MIIPEKSEPVASSSPSTVTTSPSPILSTPYNPAIMAKLNPKATAVDAQSMMSQEPPPYSEAGPSSLAGPPPEVVRPRYQSPPRHPSQGSSQSPSDRTHFHPQYLAKRDVASPEASLAPPLGPSHTLRPSSSHTQLPPIDPQAQAHSQRRRQSLPDSARNAGALVLRQNAPPIPRATFPPPSSLPSLPPPSPGPISSPLGQRCNFYSEHKKSSSLKGIYHLDLGLEIPEAVRPPTTSFHGFWNEMDKKSVRAREKEQKAREKAAKGGWGWKKVVVEPLPEKRLANQGVRPNLMLASKDGGVQAEVNVSPGPRRELATIVAESHDGSVKLTVNDPTGQPLRIFAISMDGSVRVRIPPTFQGAIWMTTEDGSVHISEGVQSRMMVFSQSTKTARCYIGDWQSTQFGRASSNPSSPDQSDPFKTWTGPLAHIYARDGSVHISLTGEDTSSTFTKAMKSIYHGIVGVAHEDEEAKQRREQWSHQLQNDPRMVWQARSLEAMPPRMGLTGLVPPKETH